MGRSRNIQAKASFLWVTQMTRVIAWMQATVWVLERLYVNDTLWVEWQVGKILENFMG